MSEHISYSLMSRVAVSPVGRVTHINNSAIATEPDEWEAAVLDEARADCIQTIELVAVGGVIPAALQVQSEHGVTTRDMFGLVARSAFVPPRRRLSFARGLALGFQGEFMLAAHLLMPQFENALREFIEARGAVVSSLLDSRLQSELDLGKLLAMSKVKSFLGDDEHFEVESLLVHKAGRNLRNELAHGLFNDGTRDAFLAYFWWKVLRYVVLLSGMADVSDIAVADDDDDDDEGDDVEEAPGGGSGDPPTPP